eukprot:jgi/Mesvir1/24194/Mv10910-RA.1
MSLVLQAYAPLSASETGHAALPQRWLFVFGCARKNCGLDPASWKVLRVQAPPLEPAQTPHAGQAVTVAAAETPPARCGAEGGAVQGRDGHGVVGGEVPGVPVDTLGWGEAVASFSGDAGAGWGDEASTQGGQYAWGDGAGWGNGGQENNSASGSADWGTSKGHGGGGEGAASVAGGTAASWQQGAMPFQVDMTASSSQPTWAAARENNSGDNDEGSAGDNAGAGGPLDELSELARALSQACTSAVVDHEAAGRATAKSKNKARRAAKEAVPAHMRDEYHTALPGVTSLQLEVSNSGQPFRTLTVASAPLFEMAEIYLDQIVPARNSELALNILTAATVDVTNGQAELPVSVDGTQFGTSSLTATAQGLKIDLGGLYKTVLDHPSAGYDMFTRAGQVLAITIPPGSVTADGEVVNNEVALSIYLISPI